MPALLPSAWLIATLATMGACRPSEEGNASGGEAAEDPAVNLPAVALPAPAMDREELLLAVARAASARSAGVDDERVQRELDGKPFELRIRFGCEGPTDALDSSALGWSYQADKGTLRLRAMPTITAEDSVAVAIGGAAVEAVEGFWLPRPWLFQATCPATGAARLTGSATDSTTSAEQAPQPAARPPRIGIAQFFTSTDPRTRRRDRRAYEAVEAVEHRESIGRGGFDLILSGRLRRVPGKSVIECIPTGPDMPPDCIVSADIDEVRMQQPADASVIARWSS